MENSSNRVGSSSLPKDELQKKVENKCIEAVDLHMPPAMQCQLSNKVVATREPLSSLATDSRGESSKEELSIKSSTHCKNWYRNRHVISILLLRTT